MVKSKKSKTINVISKKGGINPPPYFIFTAGATGSGKSQLIGLTKTQLKIDDLDFFELKIDDLIENNPNYKLQINDIICKMIEAFITNKSSIELMPTIEKAFGDSYFSTRKSQHCKSENIKSCDEILDSELQKLLSQSSNILLETTGLSYPEWIFTDSAFSNIHNYKIIFSYSIVNLCTLQQRNIKRFLKTLKKYLDNSTLNSAPRLPSNLLINSTQIRNVLFNIIEQCKVKFNKAYCNKKIRILIFDNSSSDAKILYDSENEFNDTVKRKIDDAFALYSDCQ